VRVSSQEVVTPAVERSARSLLAGLGVGRVSEVTLLNPVRLDGVVVRPAAIAPLSPWIGGGARAPGRCRPDSCPMLLASPSAGSRLAGRTAALTSAGVRLTVAGRTMLRSAAALGFIPGRSVAGPPVLLTADVAGLESLAGLSGIYRTHTWVAPLAVSRLHSWQLAGLERRLQRAQAALPPGSGAFVLSAPLAELDAARAQARQAPKRLLLAGGGALAALVLFVVLIVGGLREDVDDELTRLRTAGARPWQCAVMVAAESGLVCGGALVLGGSLAIVVAAVLAAAAGEPVGGVLAHSLLSGAGALAIAGAWVGATAWIGALLLIPRAARIADAAALAAVAALALALARGSSGDDPLPVLLAPLCCLAAGVVVYRAAGAALRGGERLARGGPLPVRLALVGLARNPGLPSLSIAFLATATGLGGFALCYRATLERGASDEAANAVPLDAIVAPGPDFTTPLQLASSRHWGAIGGGTAWPVRRTDASFISAGATVTVTALGVPAAALPRLHGWRASDGPEPPAELAHRLVPPGPERSPGPLLPAGTRSLRIVSSAPAVSAIVVADLRDGDGAIRQVSLGEPPRRRGTLRARVPPAPHAGRWELEALELREPAGLEATSGHQNGEDIAAATQLTGGVSLGPVTALDASARPLLTGLNLARWRGVGAATGAVPARGSALNIRFSDSGGVGVVRPQQPSDHRPVPVLADRATAAASGPDGRLALSVGGQPVSARVVGVLKRFPTVPAGAAGFVVADEATLAAALDAQLPGQGRADEVWISTPDPQRVRAALARGPLSQLSASFRDSIRSRLRSAPTERGVLGTLVAAAALSVALAIVGLLFATLGGVRDRRTETDLGAQGVGPRGLRREVRVRLGLAGTAGVAIGLVIALVLTRLAVASVRAAGSLAAPQPSLVTVTPASELALWALATLAALIATGWVATLASGRRR
jgi:hypothetical protein